MYCTHEGCTQNLYSFTIRSLEELVHLKNERKNYIFISMSQIENIAGTEFDELVQQELLGELDSRVNDLLDM